MFKKLAIISLALTALSFSISKPIVCENGVFVTKFGERSCTDGQVLYSVNGWPIGFYWGNGTGFVVKWFVADFLIYMLFFVGALLVYRRFTSSKKYQNTL